MNNNFFDNMKNMMDPQNFMQNMKNMPNFDMNNMASMFKKNAEAMSNMSQVAAENVQAMVRRNAEIAQKSASDAFNMMKDMASSNNPEHSMAKQQQYMKHAFENAMSNTKEMAEMMTKSGMEVFDMLGNKINENINECFNCASPQPKKKAN
jgi:phasin family protein